MPPLTQAEVAAELAPYGVELSSSALEQLGVYLELLLSWNRRIRLTGLREPRRMVRELFGESLFLARLVPLQGWVVDVGSGAGFPGLALKLAAPELRVTLVEARARKCAFLKEVTRRCGFSGVEVVARRLEEWAPQQSDRKADCITTRAVSAVPELLQLCVTLLGKGGRLVLSTTNAQVSRIRSSLSGVRWEVERAVPGARVRVILVGTL